MKHTSFNTALLLLSLVSLAAPASAQHSPRSGAPRGAAPAGPRGAAPAGRAVPRAAPAPGPRGGAGSVYRPYGYRPYGYPYRPYSYYPYYPYYSSGIHVGVSFGFGYPYYYGYPYGAYGYYGYGYGYPYGYSYGYPGYYAPTWGGVRIHGAADAEVYADGYYVGVIDDFDGALQQLNLDAGPHHLEIRAAGAPALSFDVNVIPGQTITYRAAQPH